VYCQLTAIMATAIGSTSDSREAVQVLTHRWLHCEDVLCLILAEIPRPNLKSASLINRDFAIVARGFILQRFVLDISDENKCTTRRLDTLRSSPHISERSH